ncbi:hypothetical protein GC097_17155 [Paenibacillus sp. LMG 31457]|uniref:Uncharacterized protein n=2 Tax=Paenibacillus planticolens TaxID=2654976 RepID=A0ABX1ZS41_9BACL|nr:hypothetical protein [Paenibacillus planticolens]
MQSDSLLIAAPTKAGEAFMAQVKLAGMPFIALTNNKPNKRRLEAQGVEHIIQVDTLEPWATNMPDCPIGNVILFEESLPLSCRYLQICRRWTSKPIYVVTQSVNPRLIYKGLGADYVIYSKNGDVRFLLGSPGFH